MKKILNFYIFIFFTIYLTGCTQKLVVSSYEPSKINTFSSNSLISVSDFLNDQHNFKLRLQNKMSQKSILSKQYFKLSSTDNSSDIKIDGEVLQSIISHKDYHEERTKCINSECKEKIKYKVRCFSKRYYLEVNININDLKSKDILYSNIFNNSTEQYYCFDNNNILKSDQEVFSNLADIVVDEFIYLISPNKIVYKIEVKDESDIKFDAVQKRLFEDSLAHLEKLNYNLAKDGFLELLEKVDNSCYATAYNIGLIYEVLGEYEKAKGFYKISYNINHNDEYIQKALLRIDLQIDNTKKVLEQISTY